VSGFASRVMGTIITNSIFAACGGIVAYFTCPNGINRRTGRGNLPMSNDAQRSGTKRESGTAFTVAGVVFLSFPFAIPADVPLNFLAAAAAAVSAYVMTIAVLRKRHDSASDDQHNSNS
jgi:hypothetical protein